MNMTSQWSLSQRYACGLAVLLALTGIGAGDWPQWRGPDRLNASREAGLLKQWPADGPPLVWRATGIGLGIHSVSVAEGRVFTVGNRDGGEFVFALNAQTGAKLWATRVDNSIEENPLMRWLTQRSPTVDGDRLYTFTASGELVCLRAADGAKLWQRSYSKDFGVKRPQWGFCDHPLVDGERLICSPFTAEAALAALNKHSGEIIWKTSCHERIEPGYAALIRSTAGGIPQFIHFHGAGLTGFAADDGRMLWRYARPDTQIGSTYTPIARGDSILSPNGYGGGLVLFKAVRGDGGFTTEQIAHHKINLDPFQDCTAVVDGRLYLLKSGMPVCVDANTGVRIWGDAGASRSVRAAMTWANGHLYIRNAGGEVTLTEVLPDGTAERGRFPIPEHAQSLGVTSPVVANGRLWLRDDNRLFCFDVSATAPAAGRLPPQHLAIGLTDSELGIDPNAPRVPRTGVDRAPDAVFVPTPHDIVERMLQEAGVKKTDVVVDLGSGDGRYVIAAAKKFGCRAIGYEIDERLVEQSRESLAKENLGALASIEHKDIFTLDLSGADVVTVFLYPRLMERLIPQLDKLKPGSRILSHQFEMPGVKPDKTWIVESKEDGDKHRIFLWTTPLKKNPAP
jgi:outer membrane protein assembly factor BamB